METISKVYLVMEVAPQGEMYTRITNEGKYEEKAAKHLFSQLISAVDFMVSVPSRAQVVRPTHSSYLFPSEMMLIESDWCLFILQHDNDLYHRDIKAENVFLSAPDRVLLGDFGFSTKIVNNGPEQQNQQLLTTFCGSPPYAAPELFHDDAYSGSAVDIWALGVLLFFMVTATLPFQVSSYRNAQE